MVIFCTCTICTRPPDQIVMWPGNKATIHVAMKVHNGHVMSIRHACTRFDGVVAYLATLPSGESEGESDPLLALSRLPRLVELC